MPTYSEVTIEFTNDWVLTDIIKIKTVDSDTNATILQQTWTWVSSRSSSYEVTQGTPTANAGETAAINFKSAFDLDFPTGYVTTVQNTNEVLIQSETEGELFASILIDDEQTGTGTITFNNYIPPFDVSAVTTALVRSPYYIYTPFFSDTTTAINIDLYIWDGDVSSVPATVTESITKTRPTVNYSEFNTNISDILRTNINETPVYDITPNIQLIDNNNAKWCQYVASYTDPDEVITDIQDTFLAVEGYGYYNEGINPTTPANLILSDCNNRRVDRNGFVLLPFVNNGTITSIDVDTEGSEINSTLTPTTSNQSTDYIQYVSVNVAQAATDETLTITFNPAGTVYTFNIEDECRYDPLYVVFKNKYGMYENIYLFKKRVDSIMTESEMFVNNYISSGTYDTTKHQLQKQNIQAKEKLTCNSGYISEDENSLYKQLLLSDKVFLYDNGYIPVNVVNSNLEFKTRVNDRLTNYSIEFEYAYNTIQNI